MSIVSIYFDLRVSVDEIFQFCENFEVEMLLINYEDDADLEGIEKELEQTEQILVSLFSVNRLSSSVLPKLQEKVLPMETFLIHTDILSDRYAVFPNKDSTPKQLAQ